MQPTPTRRRGFPGGLRAQLLFGLILVIALVFLLGAGLFYLPTAGEVTPEGARTLILTYLALAALLILLLGYAFFTYLVLRPIRAIGVATQRAAKGDLASPIAHLPRNEFGQLSRQFNIMLAELAKNRRKLEERLAQLDRANHQLQRAQDSLIRSERLAGVGQLAAGVAHEIGNPLAAVSGYLELLEDEDLPADTRRDIRERAQREVERIQRIVRDLLDYSREDKSAEIAPIDLAKSINEAIHLLKAQPRAQFIQLSQAIPADLPPVLAIESEVVQILVNLLVNAADALNEDTKKSAQKTATIQIIAEKSDDHTVTLRVEDNGPGIDLETQRRLFDPFFTTKEPGAGTGLGLAVCHRLMKRFGGDIRVISEQNIGTKFELLFKIDSYSA